MSDKRMLNSFALFQTLPNLPRVFACKLMLTEENVWLGARVEDGAPGSAATSFLCIEDAQIVSLCLRAKH